MVESASKTVLHLELDLETTKVLCGLPNNYIVALGILAYARRAVESGTVTAYGDQHPYLTPTPGRVILHSDFEPSAIWPEVQLHGSPIYALGMIEWAREGLMQKCVRPQFDQKVTLADSRSLDKLQ